MLHEMNQMPDVHTLNVNDNFNGAQNNRGVDSDFSVMPDNNMVDPGFSVMPDNNMIDPDFSVFPDNDVIDPDFSVMPDNGVIDPDFSVPPVWFPGGPGPVIPCGNCLPLPQPTRGFSIRFLNASPVHSNLTIQVDNRTILTNMDFAEVSRYRQYSRGFHRITIMAPNGLVYLQQNMFFGYNSTIAIVSINNRMAINAFPDGGCNTSFNTSCLRVCNLAYASGAVNVTLPNAFMSFTNTQPGNAGSFSRLQSGTYSVNVARSARPAVNLLSTFINLNPNRIYTLYVMNWNPSPDRIRILLVQDMR